MCALRLAQGEFLTRESGRRCLYLIDDFASELDDARRGLLASRLKATQSQVFVSAISAEHVMDMSDENSKMFTVEKGKTPGGSAATLPAQSAFALGRWQAAPLYS